MQAQQKLDALRQHMQQQQLDYYYVPSTDPHHNEYLPEAWQRRSWLTEFTGSAGDALIGQDNAYLWTDPRYFLQAEQELDNTLYQLMRQQQGMAPPIAKWLAQHATNQRIGVDPRVISIATANKWQAALTRINAKLISVENNLVDAVWQNQPSLELKPVIIQPTEHAGKTVTEKLADLRAALNEQNCQAHAINALDAIAWLFNIRGNDIEYNPLAISYALITDNKATLFINLSQVTKPVASHLAEANVEVLAYDEFATALATLKTNVLLEAGTASLWMQQQLTNANIKLSQSPITLMKAIKNPIEIEGMYEAHRRDAVAMIRFLYWLDNHWHGQSELSVANKLAEFRQQDPHLRGLSFNTISGFAAHGAIIHYRVSEATNMPLTDQSLYLVDSGGQYLEGTTDITRTLHLGEPTAEQKRHYTLVLQGHLALRHTCFPYGTPGEQLNAIAHWPLWQAHLDFGHGTGHGVGCYLCVHEGPQRISGAATHVPLEAGMIVSNEPGLYITDHYGIRIENCCVIKEVASVKQSLTGHGPFLGFDDLTLVPYANKLIDVDLLSNQEISWINDYHQQIFETVCDKLSNHERGWLLAETRPVSKVN